MVRFLVALCILIGALGLGGWILQRRGPARSAEDAAHRGALVAQGRKPTRPKAIPTPKVTAETDSGAAWGLEHPLSDSLCPGGMLLVPGPGQRPRFCIDRFEYPNLPGVLPAVLVSFEEARRACSLEHKRLCTDAEWTHACRGPADAARLSESGAPECNLGRVSEPVPAASFLDEKRVGALVAALDGREPSDPNRRCVTFFGVRDMAGNVSEWVESSSDQEPSVLKGGDFTSKTADCASGLRSRARHHRIFPAGFRCCAAPLAK